MTKLISKSTKPIIPIVICLSGLDPTGGAGICADIETLQMINCHTAPLISCITSQNGESFELLESILSNHLTRQLDAIIAEFKLESISVCKIGLLASKQNLTLKKFITHLRKKIPNIKIVFDPIIHSSSPINSAHLNNTQLICSQLSCFNSNDILTPNREEFFALAAIKHINNKNDNPLKFKDEIVIKALGSYLNSGIHHLLISSINESYKNNQTYFENWLVNYNNQQKKWQLDAFFNKKIRAEFHGSGCTLSSALAGFLAHQPHDQPDFKTATKKSLELCAQSLKSSKIKGINQNYPNRCFN